MTTPTTSPESNDGRHGPLVGREGVRTALRAALGRAREPGARVTCLTLLGPTGSGKSCLLDEAAAQAEGFTVYRATAQGSSRSHGLVARLLRARFELPEGLDEDDARARIRTAAAQVLGDRKVEDVCFFLGQLVDLPFRGSPLTRAVADDPAEARALQRAIVRSFVEADASRAPVLIVVDDLERADADSLDLLGGLLEAAESPLVVLAAAHPDLVTRHPEWLARGEERHVRYDVGPLSAAAASRLAQELLSPCVGGPPPSLVDAAVNLAGGNPGLLRQMVRLFHDAGVLEPAEEGADAGWQVHLDRLASVRLPLTVEDAIEARVAALSVDDRLLLERAATVGSVFWLGVVVSLGRAARAAPEVWSRADDADRAEIRDRLSGLVARDYVLELPDSTFSGEIEYVFKHNLERERLARLPSPRDQQHWHQVTADWLAQRANVRSQEETSAMLAFHLERAEATSLAALAWLDAAAAARRGFAARKAHEHYARGLELLGTADAAREIAALHDHGDVLVMLGRPDDARACFVKMLALAHRLQLPSKGGAAHNRIGRLHRDIGNLTEARRHFDAALELFESAGDERGVGACHDDIGKLLWLRGEYGDALERMLQALDVRKKLGDRRSIALSLNNIGLVWRDHGRPAKAREAFEAALTIRREIEDPIGVAQSLDELARLHCDQGEPERALPLFQEALEVAREIGERNRIAVILTDLGDTHRRLGRTEEALRILGQAEELCDELGDKLQLAEAKRCLAEAHLRAGSLRPAREAIKHAVDLFGQVRSRPHLAIALRTLGEITGAGAWGQEHTVKAVDYFMRSIAISKDIGNELEIARSYRAFADFVRGSSQYQANQEIQHEADKLATMATEIFERYSAARD
ncbi:MAG: tetratricopeptide repeat protein [Polyangiaceae bacterium]|nr:tetratricopeptide repeat protein [Polyangiaceae bacterium]